MKRIQTGFTLITALFLLVVVALLSVYMINFSSVQHSTLVYGVQGARAMQGARSGLEWGIYEVITNNNIPPICPGSTTFSTNGAGSLDAFTITVECQLSSHTEGSTTIGSNTIVTYQLTSLAETGVFGSLDYVSRILQATVSNPPP